MIAHGPALILPLLLTARHILIGSKNAAIVMLNVLVKHLADCIAVLARTRKIRRVGQIRSRAVANSAPFRGVPLRMTLPFLFSIPALAQDNAPVSRAEYEALKKQVEALTAELERVKSVQPSTTASPVPATAQGDDLQAVIDEIQERADRFDEHIRSHESGQFQFLLTGNAIFSYVAREDADSTFAATIRPLFLFQLSDRMLFEGKFEIRLIDDIEDSEVRTLAANFSYLLNDYVTLGAGKFFSPFGLYPDRFFPGKLLDHPLIYDGNTQLAPLTALGAFARGAFPIGQTELNYSLFLSNGPELRTDDPLRAGLLNFSNSFDDNDNKPVGGRVGFLPFSEIEIGYSFQYAQVDPHGFEKTDHFLHGFDAHYYKDLKWLGGALDLRFEYVFSDVEDVTYDPQGNLGFGPLAFENERHGGYVEAAYRPVHADADAIRRLEFVGRYDFLDIDDNTAPGPSDQQRYTLAVLYWITPTTAIRAGYIIDDKRRSPDQDALFLQLSVGF